MTFDVVTAVKYQLWSSGLWCRVVFTSVLKMEEIRSTERLVNTYGVTTQKTIIDSMMPFVKLSTWKDICVDNKTKELFQLQLFCRIIEGKFMTSGRVGSAHNSVYFCCCRKMATLFCTLRSAHTRLLTSTMRSNDMFCFVCFVLLCAYRIGRAWNITMSGK
jgi:hypothetical protein